MQKAAQEADIILSDNDDSEDDQVDALLLENFLYIYKILSDLFDFM